MSHMSQIAQSIRLIYCDTHGLDFSNAYVGIVNSATEAIWSGSVAGRDGTENLAQAVAKLGIPCLRHRL